MRRVKHTISKNPTHRELTVLQAASDGYTNREIGQQLKVCEQTIKSHFSRLYVRLDANNRTHAVARAIKDGLIEVS